MNKIIPLCIAAILAVAAAPMSAAGPIEEAYDNAIDPVYQCSNSSESCPGAVNATVTFIVDGACPSGVDGCLPTVDLLDADGDGYPDALESEICGRSALAEAVNATAAGECVSTVNFEPAGHGETLGNALGTLTGLAETVLATYYDLLDNDQDGIPDAAEPSLCGLENRNSAADGNCVGNDYRRP